MDRSLIRPFTAGILFGNCAPHLATAVTGRRHLTPLAGERSGPAHNAFWGVVNLVVGLALLATDKRRRHPRWGRDLLSFEAGVIVMAAWMFISEALLRVNHSNTPRTAQ